jgi:Yip1-like protein
MTQAMIVVAVSALASGMSTLRGNGPIAFLAEAVIALIGWFVWAAVCQYVGTSMLPEPQTDADLGQVLRTTGFSAAPGVICFLVIFPVVGPIFYVVGKLWMLAAMVVALKQALDYRSTGRAIGVCIIGFIVYWILIIGLGLLVVGALR